MLETIDFRASNPTTLLRKIGKAYLTRLQTAKTWKTDIKSTASCRSVTLRGSTGRVRRSGPQSASTYGCSLRRFAAILRQSFTALPRQLHYRPLLISADNIANPFPHQKYHLADRPSAEFFRFSANRALLEAPLGCNRNPI
jgi:hypothetical protein